MSEHDKLRMPAEWEACFDTVMLAWPHADTDWAGTLPRVTRCYQEMARAIAGAGMRLLIVTPAPEPAMQAIDGIVPADKVSVQTIPTNDTWTRDYGPITVERGNILRLADFRFNAWGMKFAANHDNMVCRRLKAAVPMLDCQDMVLEGGSIESDGRGTILTTSRCLMEPNRNPTLSRGNIETLLRERLGARRVLWLDHGGLAGDDTDGHIDTIARLAPDDTIIYCGAGDSGAHDYPELKMMERQLRSFTTADGNPYRLVELPAAPCLTDSDGTPMPATYANYLVTPTTVIMPSYGCADSDLRAAEILARVFPTRNVTMIDCRPLIVQHGSLHCATMQLSSSTLS